MLNTALAGLAHCAFVFVKAFQQRNVTFMHYKWVMPTSMLMSCTEVVVIGYVAIQAVTVSSILLLWPLVLAMGIGGGLGCLAAMYLHHRYIGEQRANVHSKMLSVQPRVGSIQSLRRSGGVLDLRLDIDGNPDAKGAGD